MDAHADLLLGKEICEDTSEKKLIAKNSKVVVSSAIHAEIAALATHIQQLKERLIVQSKELDPASSPCMSEDRVEDPFPTWLN